jgi:hypothetical protein
MGKKKTGKRAKKREPAKKEQKKTALGIVLVAVIVIGGYFFYTKYFSSGTIRSPRTVQAESVDASRLRGGETRPTLSPALFVGKTAAAYKIARENRELLDSMYCYCYCKVNLGHKSLLTCYVDNHAANCGICQDQAFYAYSLFKKGNTIPDVRAAVDRAFWKPLR